MSLIERRTLLVAATAAYIAFAAGPAEAQEKPTLAGTWSASALKETWTTSEWGEACGPKPTSSGGAPGGTVTVSPQGGDLAFSGAGRSFSTAECWERLPGLKRTAHSSGARGWSNKCASPAGDPRRASISNTFTATDDTIVFQETGVFEFAIKDTKCKASVSRSRSYKLQQRAGEAPPPEPTPTATASAPPPPPPEKTAEPTSSCETPGAPARIEVRPTKKLLRPGESFSLAVKVSDKAGCRLGVTPEVSQTGDEGGLSIEGLKVSAAADARAGVRRVAVALGGKTVTIEVEVAPADRYDELLKLRGLNASGEDDRAAVAEIAAGVGGIASQAEDTASARKRAFLAIVGGVAGALGLVGFALWRRGKARRQEEAERESAVPPANVTLFEGAAPRALTCPHCGRDYPSGAAFCEEDGTALIASVAPLPREPEAAPASARVPPAIPSAPSPGTAAPSRRKKPSLEKICPSCGDRFPAEASFCGKDGTQLVPVN